MTNDLPRIRRAFIVDDELIDQTLYGMIVKETGIVDELQTFTYAEDALAFLVENPDKPVDVIFLDVNMPRMDGFEFLEAAEQQVGEAFAELVVVMITTSLDPRDVARANQHPRVRHYIEKPLTHDDVREVAKLLGHH